MKVIMFSSECHPFAKIGGLANVVGALPKAIKNLKKMAFFVAYLSILVLFLLFL